MNEDAAHVRTNEILRALLEDDDSDLGKELALPGDPPPELIQQAIRAKERYLGYRFKGKPIVHTNPLGETFVFGKFGNVMSTLLYYDTTIGWKLADGQGLSESPDDSDFKDLRPDAPKFLPLGRVLHATGIEEDIIEACLETLASVDPDEAEAWRNTWKGGDEDPGYLAFEALPNALQKYCPPYTYFGSYESDGELGVWVDRTEIDEGSEDPETLQVIHQGERVRPGSRYVAIMNRDNYPVALLDGETGAEVWHVNY